MLISQSYFHTPENILLYTISCLSNLQESVVIDLSESIRGWFGAEEEIGGINYLATFLTRHGLGICGFLFQESLITICEKLTYLCSKFCLHNGCFLAFINVPHRFHSNNSGTASLLSFLTLFGVVRIVPGLACLEQILFCPLSEKETIPKCKHDIKNGRKVRYLFEQTCF